MVDKKLELGSWLLGLLLLAMPATAQETVKVSVSEEDPFTDLSREHWAYQALLRLVNQYGCIAGYPDGTFRGDQPVTRDEFAAGLNACLEVLTTLQEAQQPVSTQEVEALRESIERFQQDLSDLDGDMAE